MQLIHAQIGFDDNKNHIVGVMPNTFLAANGKPHSNTLCDGYLVNEMSPRSRSVMSRRSTPVITRLLLTDVVYINGMSLKSLPLGKRLTALRKEVLDRLHETKAKDAPAIQNSPYKSVAMRDFWPIQQIKKIKHSLIPSLTHDAEGILIIDAACPYVFGDAPSFREMLIPSRVGTLCYKHA